MSRLIEICRNVEALRKSLGYSQERAALESNLSVTLWQRVEKGSPNITIDTLERIAATLKVSPLALGALSMSDDEILAVIRKAPRVQRASKKIQLGRNIVFLRKKRHLTQRQLAALAEVSPARLRDIEHGCANVTIMLLERIAAALDIPLLALSTLTLSEEDILAMVHHARVLAGKEVA